MALKCFQCKKPFLTKKEVVMKPSDLGKKFFLMPMHQDCVSRYYVGIRRIANIATMTPQGIRFTKWLNLLPLVVGLIILAVGAVRNLEQLTNLRLKHILFAIFVLGILVVIPIYNLWAIHKYEKLPDE